jgi:hypothetical protein
MEQHCLRPLAEEDNESPSVLVSQPFENAVRGMNNPMAVLDPRMLTPSSEKIL